MDERIIALLIKKKLGTLSLTEHAELAKLLPVNDNDEKSKVLIEFWEQPLSYDNADELWNEEESVARIKTRIASPTILATKTSYFKWPKILIAASILIVFGLGVMFLTQKRPSAETENVVATRKGSKSMVVLPDGSKVWINSESKLSYATFPVKGTREITLIGEAYFDVVKDKNRPFIVHAKNADIKVLGTAFNVKAYEGEPTLETTLLRGAVELSVRGEEDRKILLKPNEKVIVKTQNAVDENIAEASARPKILLINIKRKEHANAAVSETQWIENTLVFEQEKLVDIAKVLERWYNVEITISNQTILNKKISGTFENKSVGDVLESMRAVAGFDYKIENNNITIYKK
jgi:transmembrane sensor